MWVCVLHEFVKSGSIFGSDSLTASSLSQLSTVESVSVVTRRRELRILREMDSEWEGDCD